jgi:hypothetical protein
MPRHARCGVTVMDGVDGVEGEKTTRCPVTGKQQHAAKKDASVQRSGVLTRKGKTNGRTNVYKCDWCDTWHVGRR